MESECGFSGLKLGFVYVTIKKNIFSLQAYWILRYVGCEYWTNVSTDQNAVKYICTARSL